MKRILLPVLILLALAGCSSTQNLFSGKFVRSVEPFNWSGGEVTDNSKSYYWLNRSATEPQSASDYVELSNDAWYKSSYKWQDGMIREIVREGQTAQNSHDLQRYLVHIRFSNTGEAIYQRYRIGNQVFPLNQPDLDRYVEEAERIVTKVEALHSDNLKLIQGIWDGKTFEACDGRQYTNINFQNTKLPLAIKDRINTLNSYVAFIGMTNPKRNSVTVNQLISMNDADYTCIQRPHLNMN